MLELSKNSKILVVGLGKRSGLAVCNFLSKKGYKVYASDSKSDEKLKDIIKQLTGDVKVFAGNQDPSILREGFDMVVLSPGVPKSIPLIKAAYEKNIPVIAEVELAYRFMKGFMVAITGTDGKSTTTSLVGHILSELGIKTFTGGNLGIPFITFTEETDEHSVSVLELSSFQLETIDKLKPDVSAVLNVTPDHLDRYDDMRDYLRAKLRIAMNQAPNDFYIYRKDDKMLTQNLNDIKAKKFSFSMKRDSDAFYQDGSIFIRYDGSETEVLDTSEMQILGMHNIENTMAALLIIFAVFKKNGMSVDWKRITEACLSFKGLAHRMEMIGTFNGRTFINDSKATTVSAVEMALNSVPYGSILIMGGRTKGDDYSRLTRAIKEKIKHLILIGESANDFKKYYKNVPSEVAKSMDDAVRKAVKASSIDDVILLSPACASFDMFANFEERGERFKEAVLKLVK
ncbi:MAG: UDP-N-acetylmuramoyl-L-alanine--D-glutamate ligase [Spirochaetes bacterium]|nr:UDP-N-acetylmuramoyl-L-alanine--D-glutamate ligase [Spirochaetota bacterium]